MYTYMHKDTHTYINIHPYIHIYLHAYIYIYIFIYTYITYGQMAVEANDDFEDALNLIVNTTDKSGHMKTY